MNDGSNDNERGRESTRAAGQHCRMSEQSNDHYRQARDQVSRDGPQALQTSAAGIRQHTDVSELRNTILFEISGCSQGLAASPSFLYVGRYGRICIRASRILSFGMSDWHGCAGSTSIHIRRDSSRECEKDEWSSRAGTQLDIHRSSKATAQFRCLDFAARVFGYMSIPIYKPLHRDTCGSAAHGSRGGAVFGVAYRVIIACTHSRMHFVILSVRMCIAMLPHAHAPAACCLRAQARGPLFASD